MFDDGGDDIVDKDDDHGDDNDFNTTFVVVS